MNALIKRSEEARAQLQHGAAMNDLDYHLMVLDAGCACLDELVRPLGVTASEEASNAYRRHMVRVGWWTFFELQWRHFEIRLAAEWYGPESLVPLQSEAWRRQRLIAEARSMQHTARFWRTFEIWLKQLEEKGQATLILPPATAPQPEMHHEHQH